MSHNPFDAGSLNICYQNVTLEITNLISSKVIYKCWHGNKEGTPDAVDKVANKKENLLVNIGVLLSASTRDPQ